jgi:hypothetical protein
LLDPKRYLLERPELFLLYYFPHAFRPKPDSLPKLEPFHIELIRTVDEEVRALILYPAGHGKTTIACTLMPIYWMCKDPNVRIALIAKNEVDAKGVMRSIHAELLGNERLIRDFGEFIDKEDKAKAWSIERIDIKQRTLQRKEGTIQIYGSKGNVLGKRFDRVVCDDVVTEKNSSTAEQRQSMMEWFNMGVETMPEHPGVSKLAVVGTLFDPEDLYHVIRDLCYPDSQEQIYTTKRVDAIVDEDEKITLWPERWTWESLMAQKAKMGTLDFNKRYRNFAVDASRLVFRSEYLRGGYYNKEHYEGCLDHNYRIGEFGDNWRRLAGFDPAIGSSKIAKFCAHVTIGVGSCAQHERCYWVIDLVRDQLSQQQQVDLIINKHQEYDLWKTIIEVNGYQAGLEQAVQQKIADHGLMIDVDPHVTTRNNKPDPELGVSGMSAMIENGQLHIPWGDAHSRRVMEFLVSELEIYPSGRSGATSDTVMALWFAWKTAQEAAPRYSSFNRLDRPTPSVFAKKGGRRSVQNPAYS